MEYALGYRDKHFANLGSGMIHLGLDVRSKKYLPRFWYPKMMSPITKYIDVTKDCVKDR